MAKPDPIRAQIVSRFPQFDVVKVGGGYTLRGRRYGGPVARLKPFPQSEQFELFYWSARKERWCSFGPCGPVKLSLDEIQEIIESEAVSRRKSSPLRLICAAILSRFFR